VDGYGAAGCSHVPAARGRTRLSVYACCLLDGERIGCLANLFFFSLFLFFSIFSENRISCRLQNLM
jgi:hypothetical protein